METNGKTPILILAPPPDSLDAALLRAGAPLHRLSKLLHTAPATPQITLFKIVKSRFSQP